MLSEECEIATWSRSDKITSQEGKAMAVKLQSDSQRLLYSKWCAKKLKELLLKLLFDFSQDYCLHPKYVMQNMVLCYGISNNCIPIQTIASNSPDPVLRVGS